MIPVAFINVDLNTPWTPEDAGRDLERAPAFVLVEALALAHGFMHRECAARRRAFKRRPWRWHKLRQLARDEAAYCDEVRRRANLLADIIEARQAAA